LEYAVTENTAISLRADDGSAARGAMVSSNYFPSLNVHPSYGRLFVDADGNPGAVPVAALGYGYWQTRYGSDPGIVGQTVRMNGQPVQIVGVLPFDFDGLSPHNTAVWLPETTRPYLIPGSPPVEDFGASDAELFGKPKAGVSTNAVQAQLRVVTNELRAQQPKHVMEGESIRLDPLQAMPSLGQVPAPAILFLVLTLLVLLSACANLGNVLLARGVVRERELQIRTAVGAGRWRLMRQLMTENVLLAALGCVAGLALGYAAAKALIYLLDAPPDIRIRMDWRIVLAGTVLALVSSLSFGLAPAMHAVRRGHKATRARQVLVAIQVSVGCMLLIISATIVRNVQEGTAIRVPFDYAHMVLVDPHPFFSCERCAPAGGFRLVEMEALLEKMPQVQGITAATIPPLGYRQNLARVPGLPSISLNSVEPSYFEVMNLPMLRGRTFRPNDQKPVIVAESGARAAWPNEDPIGKSLDLGRLGQVTVIGVVKDSGGNLYR
jgi:predicted permease